MLRFTIGCLKPLVVSYSVPGVGTPAIRLALLLGAGHLPAGLAGVGALLRVHLLEIRCQALEIALLIAPLAFIARTLQTKIKRVVLHSGADSDYY